MPRGIGFLPELVRKGVGGLGNLFTRPPGRFGSLDPGSLFGAYKEDPLSVAQDISFMGGVSPVKSLVNPSVVSKIKLKIGIKDIFDKITHIGTRGGELPGAILNQEELNVLGGYLKKKGADKLRGSITKSFAGEEDIVFGEIMDRIFKGSKEFLVMSRKGPNAGRFRLHSTPVNSKFFGTEIIGNIGDKLNNLIKLLK